ncbi:MAG: hypothetical protein J6I61_08235 [Prevotella sp.]|nr:hypothetical protein [Prevotella sp.]
MELGNIDKLSWKYMQQQLWLLVVMFSIGLIINRVWLVDVFLWPLIVSAAFTLVVSCASCLVWRRVAKHSPDSLPTFYTASSGFRMLLGLAVMFIYYLIAGRAAMLVFVLVFMAFYLVSLVHHSVFFARVMNK